MLLECIGSVLGYSSKTVGVETYQNSKEIIFELITQNLRQPESEASASEDDQLQSPEAGS